MGDFYRFSLTIDPNNYENLSGDLSTKLNIQEDSGVTARDLLQRVDLIQQSKFFQDESYIDIAAQHANNLGANTDSIGNIYGKTQAFQIDQEKVAQSYKETSNLDAKRFGKLEIHIAGEDGEPHVIEDIVGKVARRYPYKDKTGEITITMNHITSYLQEEYGVYISNAQKNFLNTQWDQASVKGSSANFSLTGFNNEHGIPTVANEGNSATNIFYFDKERKLEKVSYKYNVVNPYRIDQKGTFTTTADISNLSVQNSVQDPWIPQGSAKNVSIEYSSSNLPCKISKPLEESLKKHASFKGQSSSILSRFSSMFKRNSMSSPNHQTTPPVKNDNQPNRAH